MLNKISLPRETDTTIKGAYEKFIATKKAMNISPATINYYDSIMKTFTEFYGGEGLCKEITIEAVYGFINYLRERNNKIADTSINSYLRGLRVIFYYYMECGCTAQFKIKLIRAEKKTKEPYSDYELEKLLKKPDTKKCNFSEYRNWAMVCFLLATGVRLETLRNIRISDINFNHNEILLTKTKNKKQYHIPLSDTLNDVLTDYLRIRGGQVDDYLFCTQYGNQLTSEGIKTIIPRYNQNRGVTKTSIHLFRHTFAKNWILSGGDIFRLQEILGHSTLDMVKEYVAIFGGDLHNNFNKYNALDRMSNITNDKTKIRVRD